MNDQMGVFPLLLFACVNQPHDIPIGSQSVLRQPLRYLDRILLMYVLRVRSDCSGDKSLYDNSI
ncbi:hypothetical protein Hdeb2414_s0010g00348041 [Helianthus debilis subsp. tardiflorus]